MVDKYEHTHLHIPGRVHTVCGIPVDGSIAFVDDAKAANCPDCLKKPENPSEAAAAAGNAYEDQPGSTVSEPSISQHPPKPDLALDVREVAAIVAKLQTILNCLSEVVRSAAGGVSELNEVVRSAAGGVSELSEKV